MARYHTTITVPTQRADAFQYLQRFDRAVEWDPGVTAGEMLTPEPVEVGSRFSLVARFLGRDIPLVYELVEMDRYRRIVLHAENRWARSHDTITFADVGAGTGAGADSATADEHDRGRTSVEYDASLESKALGPLADLLLRPTFKAIGDRAARGLRTRLSSLDA